MLNASPWHACWPVHRKELQRPWKQQNITKESTAFPSPGIATVIGAIIKGQVAWWILGGGLRSADHRLPRDKGRQERDKRESLEAEIKQVDFPGWSVVKNPLAMQETWVWSLDQEDSLKREWKSTPVFLPEESHGQWAWWATVHRVAKSRTQLKQRSTPMPDIDAFFYLYLMPFSKR